MIDMASLSDIFRACINLPIHINMQISIQVIVSCQSEYICQENETSNNNLRLFFLEKEIARWRSDIKYELFLISD